MNDRTLYRKCVMYGRQALQARRKFLGLLPEVARRRLYKRKGFGSIHEFAAKLAGISKEQVNRVLNLEQRYADKPVLLDELTSGGASINKLIRIAPIATAENQQELVEKARKLSSRALEVFIKDHNALKKPLVDAELAHVRRLELDEDVQNELVEMREKGINVNELLRKMLKERRQKIEKEKTQLAKQQIQHKEDRDVIGKPTSRYVPAVIKRLIKEEYGTKCTVSGCARDAEHLHHENPFSKAQLHDPRQLKPLCTGHHELAHGGWKVPK